MISRKEKYPSKKYKIIVFLDRIINYFNNFWNKNTGWILLGTVIGTILALPGWLYLIM